MTPPPGLLAGFLPQLEIPHSARLVAVETKVDDNGEQTWTITFRAAAPTVPVTEQPASASAAEASTPPPPHKPQLRPPPLTELQITGGHAPPTAEVPELSEAGPISPTAPTPAAFPLLPYQQGARNRLFPLRCVVQTYAWGRYGEGSLVGKLAAANDADFALEANTPYAELWMGTHPSGPSMVLLEMPWRTITPLYEWLKLNPSMHGKRRESLLNLEQANISMPSRRRQSMLSLSKHGLPFLFKVLSVRTALSIQAHPDKELAQQLHASRPDMYKDDNHKPEMALAVSRFEALCAFQKANHVLENCRACPELVAVVGEEAVARLAAAAEAAAPLTPVLPPGSTDSSFSVPSRQGRVSREGGQSPTHMTPQDASTARLEVVKPALQNLFARLMRADPATVTLHLDALMRRIALTNPMLRTPVDELAVRLHEQYPSDVGVFCVYLLNYLALEPGQALFLGANEPHAYISGECVECMAASDNVVRAGLTPKFKDVDNLTAMLTYIDGPPHMIEPNEIGPHVFRYVTPVDEFLVDRVEVPAGAHAALPSAPGVSIILVLSGGGTLEEFPEDGQVGAAGLLHHVDAGAIFVASADTFMRIRAADHGLTLYRAAERFDTN